MGFLPRVADDGSERVEVVCNEWSREDFLLLLATLKSVRTGRIEISLRESRIVGVLRRPFPAGLAA